MDLEGTIDIYDGKTLQYVFTEVAGETYLTLGQDNTCFHVNVSDHDLKSDLRYKSLPKELAIAVTAKAVFEQAYLQEYMSRDGKIGEGSQFPFVSAQVRAGCVVPNEIKLVHSVWARRIDAVPVARAA